MQAEDEAPWDKLCFYELHTSYCFTLVLVVKNQTQNALPVSISEYKFTGFADWLWALLD